MKIREFPRVYNEKTFYRGKIIIILEKIVTNVEHRLPRITPNVPAAWRRWGYHKGSDVRETSKSAQIFGRATAPLAPNLYFAQ